MANYNTFSVVDCKTRKTILTTSSARKANREMKPGLRIDIWNDNALIDTIYQRNRDKIRPYIQAEKDYIREKQARATEKNKKRMERLKFKYG